MIIQLPKGKKRRKKKKKPEIPIGVIIRELWGELPQKDKDLQKRYHQQRKRLRHLTDKKT